MNFTEVVGSSKDEIPESKPEVPPEENERGEQRNGKSLKLKERHSKRISRGENFNKSLKGEEPEKLEVRKEKEKQKRPSLLNKSKEISASEKKMCPGILELPKYKSVIRHGAVLIQIW